MSLIITITTREGIAMAADSRLTLTFPDASFQDPNNPSTQRFISVPQSDSTRKLFLAQNRIGISTCGTATIGNVPISGFIESFIRTLPEGISVENAAESLLQHFIKMDPKLQTWFHVAGYSDSGIEKLTEAWLVGISENQRILTIGKGQQDARWNGVLDILNRLFWQVYIQPQTGKYEPIFHPGIALNHLTLQDAVDLAVFAMRTTIDLMNFQQRLRTVGGPIDVLVIKPEGSQWLSRKHLHTPGSPTETMEQAEPVQGPTAPSKAATETTTNPAKSRPASRRTFKRLT
jgi:20S proteasome alpha/beta subunit